MTEDYYDSQEILREREEFKREIQEATCYAISAYYLEWGERSSQQCNTIEASTLQGFKQSVIYLLIRQGIRIQVQA